MNYIFSLSNRKFIDENLEAMKNSFPEFLQIFCDCGEYKVRVSGLNIEGEGQAKYFVDRELNRVFYISGGNVESKFSYIDYENGMRSVQSSVAFIWDIEKKIPNDLDKQDWSDLLSLQLELWRLSHMGDIPLPLRINLLFQIIEASYPDKYQYPDYHDSSSPPDPKTECKLLRHLVSHQGEMGSGQLKKYCKYIGCQEVFFDPGDKNYFSLIEGKIKLLTDEARKAIERGFK